MAMLIAEECILCGACEPEYPNEVIGEAEEVTGWTSICARSVWVSTMSSNAF